MKTNFAVLGALLLACASANAQGTQPVVAIHDSELNRGFESQPAANGTPTGAGTTGFQWWMPDWHYFVLPESAKEALRSDGTAFTVIGDSNITAGLLTSNGAPRYPIVISLGAEAIRDDEIAPLTNYVAAGGFLFVGSSSFTRNTNGTTRGDFAIGNQMGVHMTQAALNNWGQNNTFTRQSNQRLVTHVPDGQLTWRMPSSSEEIPWGISPNHPSLAPHDVWQVNAGDATVVAVGDTYPYLLVKPYGKGYFIYYAPMNPLIGHGGFAPGMYAYVIMRKAIEWAFENSNMPVPKLSPWPYPYDSAFMVRHDLEDFQNEIADVEASAGVEFTNGAKGDYFFCTGTLRVDMGPGGYNTNNVIASLRRAMTNYGATISSHNGGLSNPDNLSLVSTNYDYWHWGPDEALDVTPSGFASGKAYATASLSNSLRNIETWLPGLMTTNMRTWVAPYFNATREDSYDLQASLGIKIIGDQKITPFPHFMFSTKTAGKRYAMVSEPVSDWFVGGLVAQSLEPWHPPGVHTSATMHSAVDFFYGLGALVNIYSHTLATGEGDAGPLTPDYITYCLNSNAHPRMWAANGIGVYNWWIARSNAQVTAACTTNGSQTTTTFTISGATDTNTTVELDVPVGISFCSLQVFTNGIAASTNRYRVNGQIIKVLVGTSVTNVIVSYYPLSAGSQVFSQNFDGVTAPALPSGWTTSFTGAGSTWVTQTNTRDTVPNSVFAPDAASVGESDLTSPIIAMPAGQAQLSFQNNFDLEPGPGGSAYDGGALEIKIGAGPFTDIVAAGGSFVTGGYTSLIDTNFGNPLAGRQVWSGSSAGFITTLINLPASASGQNVQFRWRCGSDNSNGGNGWRIDSIGITNRVCICCASNNTAPTLPAQTNRTIPELSLLVVTNTATDTDSPPQNLSYQLTVAPANAAIDANGIITWTASESQGPSTNTFKTVVTDDGVPPMSATNTFTVFVTETNSPPVLPNQSNVTVFPGTLMVVTNTATDPDVPANTLGYSLVSPPPGAGIDSSGIITWTPATGPSSNLITTVVTDNGAPPMSATNAFSVFVMDPNSPPVINTQPASRTNNAGTTATFTVSAVGASLNYQWFRGATPVGVNSATLTLSNISSNDAGNYHVTITNSFGSTNSANASLTVITPPAITSQPVSVTNNAGATVSFTVGVTGTSPTFQWMKSGTGNLINGGNVSGAGTATLTLSNISQNDGGTYSVLVTNAAGSVTSSNATLTLSTLFFDDFTRATNPGVMSPWTAQSGNWSVTNGVLSSDPDNNISYNFAYITNIWTNYSVQARVRFSTNGAYGGGISGRVQTDTGEGYAAWIYPENSPNGPALELIKFQDWYAFEYGNVSLQEMARVTLPNVGTNFHTVKLTFQDNLITVYYDSNLVVTATDTESNPYLTGSVAAGAYTQVVPFTMQVDDVTVMPLPSVLMAANDVFLAPQNGSVTIPAPGVLVNDTAAPGLGLTAIRGVGPAHGNLTFNSNGGFTYTPNNGYTGVDTFTYVANDGFSNSLPATVAIDVPPATNAFFDDFTRSGNGSTFAPWVVGNGIWTVTNGTMLGTATIANDYSDSYLPGNWGDFTIQAQVRLPANSWACGLSGRVNPVNGARYMVNLYSDTSPLGPPHAIRLIKFHNWITWSPTFTPMALVQLPGNVGTGTHTLRVTYQGTQITVFYDGTQIINMADNNADGLPPYMSGGAGVHMYMDAAFTATFDNLTITQIGASNSPPVLPAQSNRTIVELSTLIVTNTATDTNLPVQTMNYALTTAPTNAIIDTNGIITWTPTEGQGPSTNTFTTVASDNGSPPLSATNTFLVFVTETNSPPVLPNQTNRTINELTLMTVTNTASDPDVPPNALTYALTVSPTNASISTSGIITWTPNEAQGPGVYTFTTVVNDNGSPPLTATNSFTVTVNDVNSAPILPVQTNRTIVELSTLVVTNTATDTDVPANTLSYALMVSPTNASISTNGVITWTPTEAQGPSTNTFTTVVTDDGTPPMSATNTFTVFVNELNTAPTLPSQTNVTINELTLLTVTNTATDTDVPAQHLTYVLSVAPTNASISTNGVITWTPTEAQGPSTNIITTVVTDNGTPALSATNTFTVFVNEVNSAPVLPIQTNRTIGELTLMTVTNTATDSDIPANTLAYVLTAAPTNASISTNGIITWTPTELQGPSTNTFTTVVTDNGTPPLSATNTFTVVVNEVNTAPVLPVQTNVTINEMTLLTVTNTATDSDIPANTLSYALTVAPTNAAIDTNGVIMWTPTEAQGPSTNTFTTVVTDNGVPPMSATNTFTVLVNEVNTAPVLPVQTNVTINELTLLTVTNTATDSDIPANILNYVLTAGPTNASISTNGIITWTPTEAQGPSTNMFTTVVTDNGLPPLSATNTFTVFVNEVNSAPVLPVQTNRTVNELALMTVTNTATDSDVPAETLNYVLTVAPTNAAIDTNGVITWTPAESQGPSTNTFTTVVTDSGSPPASATNTFTVFVNEVNSAPVLSVQTNVTINELTLLTVTNSATDSDIPANILSYALTVAPTNASIDTNGVITWTPTEAQGPSTNTFTTVVTDNGVPPMSATNTFTVFVNEVNSAPVLPVQTNVTSAGLATVTVTNTATDSDIPANILTYVLTEAPTNASINTNGIITWTPTLSQVPSTNTFTTTVTDNGVPPLSATNTFTVVVNTVHNGPVLPSITNRTISEVTFMTVTNVAADSDVPFTTLSYALLVAPTNASIDTNGVITWTPTEAQGPSTNTFTTVVTDNGTPQLSATNTFTVFVNEVNSAPVLPVQTNVTINELTLLTVTNTATDSDIPANILSYALTVAPTNALINTNGVITWTPTEAQGPSTNTFTTVVTDNGVPPMSATNTFTVVVNEVNTAPVLPSQTNVTIAGLATVVVTNTATDTDIPVNPLGYVLTGPTNASIDTNGVISWTPLASQVPSTNTFTTVVTDTNIYAVNSQNLSATNTFTVTVDAVHNGPALPVQTNVSVNELTLLTVTNAAADGDVPAFPLTYGLLNPPNGASIDTNGVITWTPDETQGPGIITLTTIVTDGAIPALSATNSFTVTVNEVNTAPVLAAQKNRNTTGTATLIVTNTATDSDIPANVLTYHLTGPTNATIDTNGVITWTPLPSQVPSSVLITTVVTDDGVPPMSATNSFIATVLPIHNGPTLAELTNVTVNELTVLTVTNAAIDSDLPVLALTYSLVNPPDGASIDTNGVITWTPNESQGPGTNIITTVVTDNGIQPLSATNSFTVTVNEVNSAPSLPVVQNSTVQGTNTLVVTNTATDSDIPANNLAYQLVGGPTNASIDTNGVITWTPLVSQVPSTNTIVTVVTDDGVPPMSATNSFNVVVDAIHHGPHLGTIANQTVNVMIGLTVTNSATDTDIPALTVNYALVGAPTNASINTNGIINWTPVLGQGPSTNLITTVASDTGSPSMSATNSFTVVVDVPAPAPVIDSITVSNAVATITWESVQGRTYRVQYADNPTGGEWTDLTPDVVAAGATSSITNSVSSSTQRYYHVILIPQ